MSVICKSARYKFAGLVWLIGASGLPALAEIMPDDPLRPDADSPADTRTNASEASLCAGDCVNTSQSGLTLDPVLVEGRPVEVGATATALAVLSGDEIETINALRVGDVLSTVPGVFFSGLNGPRETAQIRNTLSFDNRTLFLEDGVPLQSSIYFDQSALGYSTALLNPDSISVLRGPGTALYGSDAVTGVIAITSAPATDQLGGKARLRFGQDGLYEAVFSLNQPISDAQALRLNAGVSGEEGFRDETAFDRAQAQLHHHILHQNLSIKTLITYSEVSTQSAVAIAYPDFLAGNITGSGLNPLIDPDEAIEEVQYFRAQSKIAYERGAARFELTPYLRRQRLASTLTFQPATSPREAANVNTVGLLPRAYFDHRDGSTTILGLDMELTDLDLELTQARPDIRVFGDLFVQGPQFDYQVYFTGVSPYLQHEREILPGLKVTAGLRYDALRYEFNNHLNEIAGDARLQLPDRSDNFGHLSPKLRLLWDISPRQQVFARYARGFRAPRASELYELDADQAAFELDVETFDSGELGWRTDWQAGAAHIKSELIGYYQVSRDGVVTNVRTAAGNISINAGSREFKGLEARMQAMFPKGVTTDISFAWQDFTYRQFGAEPGSPFDGAQIEEAPKFLGTFNLDWTPQALGGLTLTSRLRYIGAWPLNPAGTLSTSPEWVWTMLGAWRVTDTLVLEGRLENVLDNIYANFADAPFFAPEGRARPGSPRTISAGLRVAF